MRTSVSRVTINATPLAVWAALTDPSFVARWQYGSVLTTDWNVGGPIQFTTEWEGQLFEQWGTVLTFEEPNVVRYSLFAPRPGLEDVAENYFIMTYELGASDEGTTVTITQDDPRPSDEPEEEIEEEGGETNPILLALKEVAESIT